MYYYTRQQVGLLDKTVMIAMQQKHCCLIFCCLMSFAAATTVENLDRIIRQFRNQNITLSNGNLACKINQQFVEELLEEDNRALVLVQVENYSRLNLVGVEHFIGYDDEIFR